MSKLQAVALSVLAWQALAADGKQSMIHIDDPRNVTVGERSVVTVYLAQFQETMIVLPAGEEVTQTFVGDKKNWLAESAGSRYVSLKVAEPFSESTTLNVVSNHNKAYTFRLVMSKDHSDSKVFIDPDSQLAEQIAKAPAYVKAEDFDRVKAEADKAKQEASASIAKATSDKDASESQFRSTYPGKLHFDYSWDKKSGDKLGIERVFSDDKFTYIKAHPQETAALYEVKDGKPSLINFDFASGLYTIPKLVERGYLAVGKVKADFWRENN